MSLPTPDKTWQFNVNQALATTTVELTDHQRLLRTIKDTLVGFGLHPWTVGYSCNSVTAGTVNDGTDRWTLNTNLVWTNTTTARSWMVLKQAATGFQLLLHCRDTVSATARGIGAYLSPSAGFTGGTTTARPTATDEITLCAENETSTGNGGQWDGFNLASSVVLHVLHSSDGKCTRVFICRANACVASWFIDIPKNPASSWTTPNVGSIKGLFVTSSPTYARLVTATLANSPFFSSVNSSFSGTTLIAASTLTCEFYVGSAGTTQSVGQNITVVNDLSTSYPLLPTGIFSGTPGITTRLATMFDVWVSSTVPTTGDTFPNDTSRQFAVFGNIIVPWNGTVPVIT